MTRNEAGAIGGKFLIRNLGKKVIINIIIIANTLFIFIPLASKLTRSILAKINSPTKIRKYSEKINTVLITHHLHSYSSLSWASPVKKLL